MKEAGLEKSFANLSLIKDFFQVMSGFPNPINPRNPLMFPLYLKNLYLTTQMKKNNMLTEVVEDNPSAVLSFGNINLATRINRHIKESLEFSDMVSPPAIHFDRTISYYTHEVTKYVDYCFYKIAKRPILEHLYEFPGTCVGNKGVYNAFKFLYSKSPEFANYASDQSMLLHSELNKDYMESLVTIERQAFREKNGLSETCTVLFLAPGQYEEEYKWSIPLLKDSIKEFTNKKSISSTLTNPEELAVVISTNGNSAIESLASNLSSQIPFKLILCNSEEEKFSGMAVFLFFNKGI